MRSRAVVMVLLGLIPLPGRATVETGGELSQADVVITLQIPQKILVEYASQPVHFRPLPDGGTARSDSLPLAVLSNYDDWQIRASLEDASGNPVEVPPRSLSYRLLDDRGTVVTSGSFDGGRTASTILARGVHGRHEFLFVLLAEGDEEVPLPESRGLRLRFEAE